MKKILLALVVITSLTSLNTFASATLGEGGQQQESLSLPCAKALQDGGKLDISNPDTSFVETNLSSTNQ